MSKNLFSFYSDERKNESQKCQLTSPKILVPNLLLSKHWCRPTLSSSHFITASLASGTFGWGHKIDKCLFFNLKKNQADKIMEQKRFHNFPKAQPSLDRKLILFELQFREASWSLHAGFLERWSWTLSRTGKQTFYFKKHPDWSSPQNHSSSYFAFDGSFLSGLRLGFDVWRFYIWSK